MTSMVPQSARMDYAEGMIQLGLWYAVVLIKRRGAPVSTQVAADILSRWVNLYRLTDWWDGRYAGDVGAGFVDVRWNELLQELVPMVQASSSGDTSHLEREGLALLRPCLTTAAASTFAPVQTPFGCWNYSVVGHGIADGPGILGKLTNVPHLIDYALKIARIPRAQQHLDLHIENNCAPHSPFEDMAELIFTLMTLINDARRAQPALRNIWCNSWLNGRADFHSLFPQEWTRSAVLMTPENSGGVLFAKRRVNTDNWWGQFMARTGAFNNRLAMQFRRSGGIFPYPALLCHADIDSVEEHLQRLKIAVEG